MGRLRVRLLNVVTSSFDREKARKTITERMGIPPTKAMLLAMEDNYNRQAFLAAIQCDKGKKK